jgi:hypothetical protein
LHYTARVIGALQGPWLLGGDFNLEPDALASCGWLDLVGGRIAAPSEPTCNGRVIDFFIICAELHPSVQGVTTLHDGGISPHSPVRLWLAAGPRSHMVRRLAAPWRVDAHLPAGCPPEAAPLAFLGILPPDTPGRVEQANMDDAFDAWVVASDGVFAGLCSLGDRELSAARSRSAGPKFVWKNALGRPGSTLPRVTPVTAAWQVLSAWLRAVVAFVVAPPEAPKRAGLSAAAGTAQRLLLADGARWGRLGAACGADELRSWVGSLSRELLHDRAAAISLRAFARLQAEARTLADLRAGDSAWRSWLQEGPGAGLSRQHRMSRTAKGWTASAVGRCTDGRGTSDGDEGDGDLVEDHVALRDAERVSHQMPMDAQSEADSECASWGAEWLVGASPPPPLPLWTMSLEAPLPAPCVAAASAACRAFPAATGLGWDKMHPRALDRLPVAAMRALLRIFIMAELLGAWPIAIGVILIALLPKAEGGLRPIGLLPSLVRLWMRIRLPVAQAWQLSHERPYFYAGPAMGATVAAWRQAARAELARGLDVPYVSVMLDLAKAFERVPGTGSLSALPGKGTTCSFCDCPWPPTRWSAPSGSRACTASLW